MNNLTTEKTMTVTEVADVLNVSVRVVQIAVKKLYPEIVRNGYQTHLNEEKVTRVKMELQSHHNLEGTFEVATELEMAEMVVKVVSHYTEKAKSLEKQIEELKPKALQYDTFLNNESNQKIGDVAKIFGIKPHKLFQMLRDAKILKDNYVPYEPYEHHFKTVETPTKGGFNVFTSYIKPSGIDYISRRFNLQRSA